MELYIAYTKSQESRKRSVEITAISCWNYDDFVGMLVFVTEILTITKIFLQSKNLTSMQLLICLTGLIAR